MTKRLLFMPHLMADRLTVVLFERNWAPTPQQHEEIAVRLWEVIADNGPANSRVFTEYCRDRNTLTVQILERWGLQHLLARLYWMPLRLLRGESAGFRHLMLDDPTRLIQSVVTAVLGRGK